MFPAIERKLSAINAKAKRELKDTDLHRIRIHLKDLLYITEIFRDIIKKEIPSPFQNKDLRKKIEKLTVQLGLFNDASVSLSYISPVKVKKATIVEINHLEAVRNKLLLKKKKLKKEILFSLREVNI